MENFNTFIQTHFKISLVFLGLGFAFGIVYSLNLLGYSINSETLEPQNMRSIHISLMLYGFITLMLSYLPFLLINKEIGHSKSGLVYLNLYTIFWYIFLINMVISLLFGNSRGLAFYDFPYELNFILAGAGIFYIIALFKFVKQYKVFPLWIKISLGVVIIAPIMLLILMNPIIGQVESTVTGPHGDNTLGMSLALIPIYYLIIKLLNKEDFKARWNIFWIIPTVFYFISVLYRIFFEPLTYNEEWFYQYLTLLYIPLLYRWYKDSDIDGFARVSLLTSIIAFIFVDIEGNILFIPELRWIFHRNDLIVAHAHIAMGIGVFFMVISMFSNHVSLINKKSFFGLYLVGVLGMAIVLSISGFIQTNMLDIDIRYMWYSRTIFGVVIFLSLLTLIKYRLHLSILEKYNLIGALNDGLGGIFLIFFASYVYPLVGFSFEARYEYIVFTFVSMTGVIHLMALVYKEHIKVLTNVTVVIRVFISAIFFSLYSAGILGIEALVVSLFDISFLSYYLIIIYNREKLCRG